MYFCEFCNYSTIRKNDFEKHNKTDKHNEILKNLIVYGGTENLQKKTIRSSTNEHKRAQMPKKVAQKEHKSSTNVLFCSQKLAQNDNDYRCEYCQKSHKTKANLRRHIKNYCKIKKKMDLEEIQNKKVEEEQQLKINEAIKKHESEKQQLFNQIEKLLEKVGTTNVTNNIDNSTTNQQNNIIINNFGEENLEMLTNNFMNNMIQYPFSAIPKMIKKTHFNDKHPENKNIRMLNKKDNKLQIRKNNKWEYVDKKDTFKILIEDKNYQMDKFYEENKPSYNQKSIKRYETYQDKITNNAKVYYEINKETELIMWNNM